MSCELSGVDLARQALVAAREAAKKNGGTQAKKPKRRTGAVVRRDGREPLGLGSAISMMMTERGMVAPAAGGSVLAQFDDILAAAAPELAGHVQAVKFDADTGRLDVAPDAPAYGTKLRWSAPKLVAAANEKVRDANVRTVNVLAPAPVKAGSAMAAADPIPQTAPPAGLVHQRTPPDGYRLAVEAHRQAARPSRVDPDIAEAVERQTAAMRELSRRAFLEHDVLSDDASASIEQVRAEGRRPAEVSRAAALRRARAEKPERCPAADREGERVEATVTIAAVCRFGGHVRLLLESHNGETAHAQVSASRFAAAEEALGRSLKASDQVLVRGYVEQEPALRAGIKSVDVGSIRAEA